MESISKFTSEVWEDNLSAFMKWGENHKTNMCLATESQRFDSFVQNLTYNYKFICHFSAMHDLFYFSISKIMDALSIEENLLVYWDESEKCKDDSWIGIKDSQSKLNISFPFKVFICSNEQVQNMVPEIKCPNFKHNFYNFRRDQYIYNLIYSEISICPVLLVKDNGVIKFKQMKNLIFDASPDEYREPIVNKWKIKDWYWKPKIIGNILNGSFDKVYSAIESGLVSSTVHDFRCGKSIQFIDKFYQNRKTRIYNNLNYSKETETLQKILKLLEINKNSSIKAPSFIIKYNEKVEKSYWLQVKAKEFIFSFREEKYKVKCNCPFIHINGSIYFPEDKDTIVIEWEFLKCSKWVITTEEDCSLFKSDWFDSLLDPEIPDEFLDLESQDKLGLYIAIKKTDIKGILYNNFEIINETWHYQNLERIFLGAAINNVDQDYFYHILELLPKTVHLGINWTKDSWYLRDELFWTLVFNFRKIELNEYNNDWFLIIDCQLEVFNTHFKMRRNYNDSVSNFLGLDGYYDKIKRAFKNKQG